MGKKVYDYIKYSELNDEKDIIISKDGTITSIFKIISPDLQNSTEKQNKASESFNEFLSKLPPKVIIHSDYQKVIDPDVYVTTPYLDMADKAFDEDRKKHYESEFYYKNELYISISIMARITEHGISDVSLEEFELILNDLSVALATEKIKTERLQSDALITYLAKKINLIDYELTCPDIVLGLDKFLSLEPMKFSRNPFRIGDKYCCALSFNSHPSNCTIPQMLEGLEACKFPLSFTTRFITLDTEETYNLLKKERLKKDGQKMTLRQHILGFFGSREAAQLPPDRKAEQDEAQVVSAMDEWEDQQMTIGTTTATIFVYSVDRVDLDARVKAVEKILKKAKYGILNEFYGSINAFLGSLPGYYRRSSRNFRYTSKNFSDLLLLTTPYKGFKVNKKLAEWTKTKAPHLIVTNAADRSIYYLNLNGSKDVGHTAILGPTGAGKSILLNTLVSQWYKYEDVRTIIFDIGKSALAMTLKNEGAYFEPSVENEKFCFQPLKNISKNKAACVDFIESICDVQNVEFTAVERAMVSKVLDKVPAKNETLNAFYHILKAQDNDSKIVRAVENYIMGGTYGTLFDAKSDVLAKDTWPKRVMFEMDELLNSGDAVVIPALVYIFRRLESVLGDKPTLIVLDEAWNYFKNELFREYIIRWLKIMRKKKTFVILATQDLEDVKSDTTRIINNCHTKIFLANKNAISKLMIEKYEQWNVPDHMIQRIGISKPQQHYTLLQEEGNITFDLELTKKQLELLEKKEASYE